MLSLFFAALLLFVVVAVDRSMVGTGTSFPCNNSFPLVGIPKYSDTYCNKLIGVAVVVVAEEDMMRMVMVMTWMMMMVDDDDG